MPYRVLRSAGSTRWKVGGGWSLIVQGPWGGWQTLAVGSGAGEPDWLFGEGPMVGYDCVGPVRADGHSWSRPVEV